MQPFVRLQYAGVLSGDDPVIAVRLQGAAQGGARLEGLFVKAPRAADPRAGRADRNLRVLRECDLPSTALAAFKPDRSGRDGDLIRLDQPPVQGVPVLPIFAVDPPDERVRLQPCQRYGVDRIRILRAEVASRSDRPQQPVAVPVRRVLSGDSLKPDGRRVESDRDWGEAAPTIRRRQNLGFSDAHLLLCGEPVRPAILRRIGDCAGEVGMRDRALAAHSLGHSVKEAREQVRVELGRARQVVPELACEAFGRHPQEIRGDVRRCNPVDLKRVAEMRPVAQVDEILPAEQQLHLIQEGIVFDGNSALDQILVPTSPRLLLRDEKGGERIPAKRIQLSGRNLFDHLVQAHAAHFGLVQCGMERFLVNGERVANLRDRSPVRRILNRVREHQEARLCVWSLFVLSRRAERPGDSGREPGRPHPEQEKATRLTAGGAGPVYLTVGIGGIVHPDRCGRSCLEAVESPRGELNCLRVEPTLHNLGAAAARLGYPLERLVVEETNLPSAVFVEELLVELLERSPAGFRAPALPPQMGGRAAPVAVHDRQVSFEPVPIQIQRMVKVHLAMLSVLFKTGQVHDHAGHLPDPKLEPDIEEGPRLFRRAGSGKGDQSHN